MRNINVVAKKNGQKWSQNSLLIGLFFSFRIGVYKLDKEHITEISAIFITGLKSPEEFPANILYLQRNKSVTIIVDNKCCFIISKFLEA